MNAWIEWVGLSLVATSLAILTWANLVRSQARFERMRADQEKKHRREVSR